MSSARRRKPARPRDPGALYGIALDKLTRAERDLARAFTRWDRARRERALDRLQGCSDK